MTCCKCNEQAAFLQVLEIRRGGGTEKTERPYCRTHNQHAVEKDCNAQMIERQEYSRVMDW